MTMQAEWRQKRIRLDPWALGGHGALWFVVAVLLASAGAVLWQALPAWRHSGWDLVTSAEWFYRHEMFGAGAMIYGSVVASAIALLLALPLAVMASIYLSEYLNPRQRWAGKLLVESLAAVPSVVYGLLGILVLREWLGRGLAPFGAWSGDTLLTAGVLLAIMILPTAVTLADDALQAVGRSQRAAARGLGLTRTESILHVVLPQAWPGVLSAGVLALGRALGETIAVFLVIGRMDNQLPERLLSGRPLVEPGQTLTSKLGGPETHLAAGDPLHWGAIMTLCAMLFAITALCATGGLLLRKRSLNRGEGGTA